MPPMPLMDGTGAPGEEFARFGPRKGIHACPRLRKSPSPSSCRSTARAVGAASRPAPSTASSSGTEINPQTGLIPVVLNLEDCSACGLCMTACPEPYGLAPELDVGLRAPGPGEALRGPAVRGRDAGRRSRTSASRCPTTRPLVTKGTYASAIGALLAGCRHFFGYPDHPVHRGRGADGEAAAAARRRLRAGGERGGHRQHDVRLRRGGAAGDDLHVLAGLQPDARGRLVHDRGRAARRLRQRDARRPRPREHRPGAGGHQARLPRARPRQHPGRRPRALDARRRCSTSRSWPSSSPSSTGTRS